MREQIGSNGKKDTLVIKEDRKTVCDFWEFASDVLRLFLVTAGGIESRDVKRTNLACDSGIWIS